MNNTKKKEAETVEHGRPKKGEKYNSFISFTQFHGQVILAGLKLDFTLSSCLSWCFSGMVCYRAATVDNYFKNSFPKVLSNTSHKFIVMSSATSTQVFSCSQKPCRFVELEIVNCPQVHVWGVCAWSLLPTSLHRIHRK